VGDPALLQLASVGVEAVEADLHPMNVQSSDDGHRVHPQAPKGKAPECEQVRDGNSV
jgi:hypothetical protein